MQTGAVLSVAATGEQEWISPKSVRARSSHDDSIHLRSQGGDGTGMATELYIDGNPAKYIQGHNVFGTDQLIPLLLALLDELWWPYLYDVNFDQLREEVSRGNFEVLGLHINYSFDAGSSMRASALMDALAIKSRTRKGKAQSDGGTVYWNKSKRKNRWLIKSYIKEEEILKGPKKQRLKEHLQGQGIEEYVSGLVRVELEIYKQELKEQHGLLWGYQFTPQVIENLFAQYWERIEMSTQAQIASDELASLPRHIRSTYLSWQGGVNPRSLMSKPTFYRHRKELLSYGVDIALPCQESTKSNVIPMFQTIEAKPVGIPDFAREKGLVFDPVRLVS
jgi:II/X family phage/plasmid replication protein